MAGRDYPLSLGYQARQGGPVRESCFRLQARVAFAASTMMSTTFPGAVSRGVWSTECDRTVAFMRSAMKRCVLGLIIRSCSARRYHTGLVFHAGRPTAS